MKRKTVTGIYARSIFCFVSALCLLTAIPQNAFAQTADSEFSDQQMTFVLPINATCSPKMNLVVKTPEGMYASRKEILVFSNAKNCKILFTPDPKNLGKKRIVQYFSITKTVSEKERSTEVVADILQDRLKGPQLEIVRYETVVKENYEYSIALLQYMRPDGVLALEYTAVYSGPHDVHLVKYSEVLDRWLKGAALEQKANEFYRNISPLVHVS